MAALTERHYRQFRGNRRERLRNDLSAEDWLNVSGAITGPINAAAQAFTLLAAVIA